MPRYYFDTDDGERQVCSEIGIDLATRTDVEREAATILQNLGFAFIPEGRPRVITAAVRDEQGEIVYRASMSLTIERDTPQGGAPRRARPYGPAPDLG